jgi:hypothetical protein
MRSARGSPSSKNLFFFPTERSRLMPIDLSGYKVWSEKEFERAFPPAPVSSKANRGTQGAASKPDDIDELALPDDLFDLVRDGVRRSQDRSRFFMGVVAGLKERGFTVDDVYDLLARYPNGIADKYLRPKDRLKREIERAYGKIDAGTTSPSVSPPPVSPPASLPSSGSSPLGDARAVLRSGSVIISA